MLRRRPGLGGLALAGMRQRRHRIRAPWPVVPRARTGRSPHRLVDLRAPPGRSPSSIARSLRCARQWTWTEGCRTPDRRAVFQAVTGELRLPEEPQRAALDEPRSVGMGCLVGPARTRVRHRRPRGPSWPPRACSSRTAERRDVPSGKISSSPRSARDVQWLMLAVSPAVSDHQAAASARMCVRRRRVRTARATASPWRCGLDSGSRGIAPDQSDMRSMSPSARAVMERGVDVAVLFPPRWRACSAST